MKIKAIKGYEDTYAVSDDGRVFNIRSGIELKPKDNKGYFEVTLSSNIGKKHFRVHILVYQAFVGELDDSLVIDHIDGNRKNNHQSNLIKSARNPRSLYPRWMNCH